MSDLAARPHIDAVGLRRPARRRRHLDRGAGVGLAPAAPVLPLAAGRGEPRPDVDDPHPAEIVVVLDVQRLHEPRVAPAEALIDDPSTDPFLPTPGPDLL